MPCCETPRRHCHSAIAPKAYLYTPNSLAYDADEKHGDPFQLDAQARHIVLRALLGMHCLSVRHTIFSCFSKHVPDVFDMPCIQALVRQCFNIWQIDTLEHHCNEMKGN